MKYQTERVALGYVTVFVPVHDPLQVKIHWYKKLEFLWLHNSKSLFSWGSTLRPAVKKLSVASQSVCFTCNSCVPSCQPPSTTSCDPRLVRNCISCIERYGYTKCPTIWRFLHTFIVLCFIHNYMHTYRILDWYRQYGCYCLMFKLY